MFLQPLQTVEIFKSNGSHQDYVAGEAIFKEGETATAMYGVVSGKVNIVVGDRVVETIEEGDIFGIGALVHPDLQRSSSAVAMTDCQIVSLDREHFLFAVQETPLFSLEVMRSYSDRLRHLREMGEFE